MIETERAGMSAIGQALALAGSMTWEILWALVLGFFLSAVVQAVVRNRSQMISPSVASQNMPMASIPNAAIRRRTNPSW